MKVECWVTGKTSEAYLAEGVAQYVERLRHYLPFRMETLPEVKNAGKYTPLQLKAREGEILLGKLQSDDYLALLDERGREFSSLEWARWLEQQLNLPRRRLIFAIGGAWGFAEAVYQRADFQLALSRMTFSHQMARLFFLEQLYRAMTILRNEPYHNA